MSASICIPSPKDATLKMKAVYHTADKYGEPCTQLNIYDGEHNFSIFATDAQLDRLVGVLTAAQNARDAMQQSSKAIDRAYTAIRRGTAA